MLSELDNFLAVSPGKIRILNVSPSERKILHLYFERLSPKIKKTSLRCGFFDRHKETRYYSKCHNCDYKWVLLNEYHRGSMENNIDESISGECPKCHDYIFHEFNYDDGLRYVKSKNIFAFGNYFSNYSNETRIQLDFGVQDLESEVLRIINLNDFYDLNEPSGNLNKKRLGKYLKQELLKIYHFKF